MGEEDTAGPGSTGTPPVVEVAAGVIFRAGKLLIAQRYPDAHQGGLWEFPGGKRHPDETFAACLERELREELGIAVEILEPIESILHAYTDKTVHLEFFRCAWLRNEPRSLGCHAFRWIAREELAGYDFPAADARLLGRLCEDAELWRTQPNSP